MAKNPRAKNSSGKYLDPAAAIKAGLMQKKTGEFMSPGKAVAKVVAKVAGKTAAKSGEKSIVKAAEIMTKRSAKEKKIIAKLDKEAPKAKAKAQKMIDKEIKKNPNLFKKNPTKAEAKANARGLKAANKPVKSKDADLINRNNPYARSAILSEKPARANRTRLGKDAFKSN